METSTTTDRVDDVVVCYASRTITLNSNITHHTTVAVRQFLNTIFGFKPMHDWAKNLQYTKVNGELTPVIPNITVEINSYGGYCVEGLAIYDMLKNIPDDIKLTTIVLGKAMSMGSIIMCAGHERLVHKNSMVLLHDLSGGIIGSLGEMQDSLDQSKRIMERLYQILAEGSGKSLTEIKKDVSRRELTLFGKEAVDYGIATGVIGDDKPKTKRKRG